MYRHFRKLLAVLLTLALIVGLLPTLATAQNNTNRANRVHIYTEAENRVIEDDVFNKIDAVKSNAAMKLGGVSKMVEADYVRMIPEVIDAIKSSETYVPGTLQRNGNFLVWETTVGIPCCYDPRMEAELHNTANDPTPEEIARIEEDAQSMLIDYAQTRGGSPSSTKIGLIQPYWESSSSYSDSSFTSYSPYYKTTWQNLYGATGGQGIRYSMTNATVDNIASTLQQCGLVIFDSHGTTDYSGSNSDYTSRANSSYLCLTTNSGVTSTDTQARTGTYGTYYNAMKGSGYAYVNGDCLAAHMSGNAPHSMLYMGICLGMATDKMFSGLRAKGVEVVYGYSQSVSFKGELKSVQSIMGYIQNGKTAGEAIEQSQVDLGCQWDAAYPSYTESQARSNKIAFPVAVSSEDSYLGHGNVDCVQTVKSTWTLFGSSTSYTVTATSNNTSYGTVSVSGNTITASPKAGYYASGYTVTSGTATVTQNGNTFTVTPSSDCTIRINFAAKTQVTLTYKANGTTVKTSTVYADEATTLPTTATAYDGYTFVGWSLNTVSDTTTKPTYYAPGASYTPTASKTFYAVYTRVENGTGAVTYNLLTSAPSDWAGDYVITYGSSPSYVMTAVTPSSNGAQIESTSNRTDYSSTGMSLSNSALSNVADKYVFTVAATGSYYTIQAKTTGTYLGMDSSSYLSGYTTYSSSYCRWTPGYGSNASTAKNVASGSYPYLGFSSSSNYFWSASSATSSTSTNVRWWKASQSGTVYYSTTITEQTEPDPVYYTVTFNSNGGSSVASQTVLEGSTATRPADPTKSGYTFAGWYKDSSLTTAYNFSTAVTANITLYAKWTENAAEPTDDNVFTLTNTLIDGQRVVIYHPDRGYAISNVVSSSNSSRLTGQTVTVSNGTITNPADAVIWTVQAASNGFYLVDASGNKLSNKNGSGLLLNSTNTIWKVVTASTSNCVYVRDVSNSKEIESTGSSNTYSVYTYSSSYEDDAAMQIYAATGSTTTDPEPTETYTVSFSVPSGVSAIDPITVEPDEAFTLPTAGAPSGYTFVGWTTSAVSSTTTAPTSYAGGISVTTSGSLTLYALYTYTRTTTGNGGYELVTSAPSDWTGDYVITCGTGSDLYAMKGLSGNTKYESASCGGAVALSSTGMTLSGTTLTNVSSAYVFTVGTSGSYYTFKNKSTGTYLGSYRSYLYSRTSLSTSYCRWTMSMNGTAVNMYNRASSSYPYMAFSNSNYFMMYSSSNTTISLWKYVGSGSTTTTYYTTL